MEGCRLHQLEVHALSQDRARVRGDEGVRPSQRSRLLSRTQEARRQPHGAVGPEAGTRVRPWASSENPTQGKMAAEELLGPQSGPQIPGGRPWMRVLPGVSLIPQGPESGQNLSVLL